MKDAIAEYKKTGIMPKKKLMDVKYSKKFDESTLTEMQQKEAEMERAKEKAKKLRLTLTLTAI